MRAIVYRFYGKQDDLLYIGMSVAGPRRWGEHMAAQPWWPQVSSIKIQHCDSITEALLAEKEAIAMERPRYNVIHTSRRPARMHDRRRPSGSGSVFRRSDGRWVASVSRGSRGQRRTVCRYRHTRADAERALLELLASD